LSRLNDLPEVLRNRIFRKLFEQAKIANMTKEEMNEYQQSLNNYRAMYLIEDEYKRHLAEREKTIASRDKTIASRDKIIASREKTIEERDNIIMSMDKSHKKAIAKIIAENAKYKARVAELEKKYGIN
jgi:hypothetical protein